MIHTFSFLLMMILSLSPHTEGTNQLEVPAGHVFVDMCDPHAENEDAVIWSQGQKQKLDEDSLPAGMKLKDQLLWFLPAQPSQNGNYSCTVNYHDGSTPFSKNFSITVTNTTCPPATKKQFLSPGLIQHLSCDSNHITNILQIDPNSHVTWMKDCSPLSWHENNTDLRFSNVKKSDEGEYTCIVKFTYEGNVYTASQTLTAFYNPGTDIDPPKVVQPQTQEVHVVTVGSRHELFCRVFVGRDGDDPAEPTRPYWLMNNEMIKNNPHLVSNTICMLEDNTSYCHCNLTILQVQTEFLHIPFTCIVLNSKGTDNGTVILVPASRSELYCGVALLLVCTVLGMFLLVFHFFKVDIVLAYRKHSPCLKRQKDGKTYDAYVSYLHDKDQNVSSATTFALHVLPEVLEDHLGYKLFISGRDALPGAAVHDVIAETVDKSRRLIIILTSEAFSKPSATVGLQKETTENFYSDLSEPAGENGYPYEWWVGLYDALVKNGLQVILVQVGRELDEAQLPETLRYVRRTQGILCWKQDYTTKPSGRFWKQLHYRMPIVQKTKLRALV